MGSGALQKSLACLEDKFGPLNTVCEPRTPAEDRGAMFAIYLYILAVPIAITTPMSLTWPGCTSRGRGDLRALRFPFLVAHQALDKWRQLEACNALSKTNKRLHSVASPSDPHTWASLGSELHSPLQYGAEHMARSRPLRIVAVGVTSIAKTAESHKGPLIV